MLAKVPYTSTGVSDWLRAVRAHDTTMSEDVTENTRNTREYTTWRNVPSRSGNSRNAVAVSGNRI